MEVSGEKKGMKSILNGGTPNTHRAYAADKIELNYNLAADDNNKRADPEPSPVVI